MRHEILLPTLLEAWQILQAEGVYVLLKRELIIPTPNPLYVAQIVGVRRVRRVYQEFSVFTDFLAMPSIADRFNKDHRARVAWSGEMIKQIGRAAFEQLYWRRNQLRLNVLSYPAMAMGDLVDLIRKPKHLDIIDKLARINARVVGVFEGYHPVTGGYDGKDYGQRELEEKWQVVQFMEDRCIDALALFANP